MTHRLYDHTYTGRLLGMTATITAEDSPKLPREMPRRYTDDSGTEWTYKGSSNGKRCLRKNCDASQHPIKDTDDE